MEVTIKGRKIEVVVKEPTGEHQEIYILATSEMQRNQTPETIKKYIDVQYKMMSELTNIGTPEDIKSLKVSHIQKIFKKITSQLTMFQAEEKEEEVLKN